MSGRVGAALADPGDALLRLGLRFVPSLVMARYGRLARASGLDAVYLVLSFDCDTDEDIEVAWEVHIRLQEMGVTPVYAVCGDLLRRGAEVYQRIAATGAEFINHGDRQHTEIDPATGRHRSCFFYDQLPTEVVRADIEKGDRSIRDVLGIEPRGFRAPHFGTFQRPEHIRMQHEVAAGLGYRYCTTTVPSLGLRHGPVIHDFDLLEFPVSGRGSRPDQILDSWSCFSAPDRIMSPADYLAEARSAAHALHQIGVGLLNFYADPSHIAGHNEFFDAVATWCDVAQPVSYSQLINRVLMHE